MFIATTGIKEFWGDKSQCIFLGPWCFIPDNLKEREVYKDRILKSPWENRQFFFEAAEYTQNFSKEFLRALSDIFNAKYNLSLSYRYWNIILGNWLNNFIGIVYDRYTCLSCAISQYPDSTTILLKDANISYHLLDKRWHKHAFELQLYSRIYKSISSNYSEKSISPLYNLAPNETNVKSRDASRIAPLRINEILLGWITHRQGMLLEVASLSKISYSHYQVLEGLINPSYEISSKELDLKNINLNIKSDFEKIAVKLLPYYMPVCYTRDFLKIRKKIKTKIKSWPKTIISGLGHQENLTTKIVAAEVQENNGTLLGIQHGSMYGIYKTLPCREFEQNINDKFFSWGWSHTDNSKIENISCLNSSFYLPKNKHKYSPKKGRILYLANQIIPYFEDFRSGLKSYGSDKYLDWQKIFFNELGPRFWKNLVFRFKSDGQLKFWKEFLTEYKGIEIQSKQAPLEYVLKESSIVVSDALTQAYIDALMVRPTILIIDPSIWSLTQSAQLAAQKLKKVGILWDNPKTAAQFLSNVYTNPDKWWNEKRVQRAKDDFLSEFAEPNILWKEDWLRLLKNTGCPK